MATDFPSKEMLVIVGASGKLGFATLNELLDRQLIPASQIVCTTSSDRGAEKLSAAAQKGVQIRRANWDDCVDTWVSTLQNCTRLFLISSSRAEKDYNEAPDGQGREADHFRVLEAAQCAGVQHVYYSSLAFANPSLSRVMKAHERTETWLHQHRKEIDFTILREGLYNESWPLYFGHYDIGKDSRSEILVAGDGPISWTSIPDLGLANAAILAAPRDQWNDKTCYLSHAATHTLNDVASMVSAAVGREVKLQVSPRAAYEKFYEQERDVDGGHVTWWSKTYDALEAGECGIRDSTLEKILEGFDTKPKDLRTTIKGMLNPTSPRP